MTVAVQRWRCEIEEQVTRQCRIQSVDCRVDAELEWRTMVPSWVVAFPCYRDLPTNRAPLQSRDRHSSASLLTRNFPARDSIEKVKGVQGQQICEWNIQKEMQVVKKVKAQKAIAVVITKKLPALPPSTTLWWNCESMNLSHFNGTSSGVK